MDLYHNLGNQLVSIVINWQLGCHYIGVVICCLGIAIAAHISSIVTTKSLKNTQHQSIDGQSNNSKLTIVINNDGCD